MHFVNARGGSRWTVAIALCSLLMPLRSAYADADPQPSPLFQHSLEKSLKRFDEKGGKSLASPARQARTEAAFARGQVGSAGESGNPNRGRQARLPAAGVGEDQSNGVTAGGTAVVNGVAIESKSVTVGTVGVTLQISISNDMDLSSVTLPLIARSVSGGAFWAGGVDSLPSSGRLTSALTDLRDLNTSAIDFVSPDPVVLLFAKLFSPCLAPGPSEVMTGLTFDVNSNPGDFEIDTAFSPPAASFGFIDCSVEPLLHVPDFTKGVVSVVPDAPNQCPIITGFGSDPVNATVGVPVGNTTSAYDPDGDLVFFSLVAGVGTVDGSTGDWAYTPTCADIPGFDIVIEATDRGLGQCPTASFHVDVSAQPLILSCNDVSVPCGDVAVQTFSASGGCPPYSLAIVNGPGVIVGNQWSYQTDCGGVGVFAVDIEVSDGLSQYVCSFNLTVTGSGSANEVVIESKSVSAGAVGVTLDISIANDADLQAVVLPLVARSVSGGAFWAGSVDSLPATGRLTSALTDLRSFNTTSVDFISPDPLSLIYSNLISPCLAWGPLQVMSGLRFDVNGSPGVFEIDTAFFPPSSFFELQSCPGEIIIDPGFTKGVVTITPSTSGGLPAMLCPAVLEQLTYTAQHSGYVPFSEYGYMGLGVVPHPTDFYYVNVVADFNGHVAWVAENLPLFPSYAYETGVARLGTEMDLTQLGVSRGTNIAGQSLCYQVHFSTSYQVSSPSLDECEFTTAFAAGIENSGVVLPVSDSPGLEPPQPRPPFEPTGDTAAVSRPGIESMEIGENECAPGAVANSMRWLEKRYGTVDLGGETPAQTLDNLKKDMKNGTTYPAGKYPGTNAEEMIRGKLRYAARHNLALDIKYQGSDLADTMQAGGRTATRQGDKATWDFIMQEMRRGQDVELLYDIYKKVGGVWKRTGGHVVVVSDINENGGNKTITLADDGDQGRDGGTRVRSTPVVTTREGDMGMPRKHGGWNIIAYVVVESPIGDPVSPTSPGWPSCPGTASCPGEPSCAGGETCPGMESCPGTPSCPGTVSCDGTASCQGMETCRWMVTCPEYPSCPDFPSCQSSSTCPGDPSCPGTSSCQGTPSCAGTETCSEQVTCPIYYTCPGTPTCPETYTCPDMITCAGYPSCHGSSTCDGFYTCMNATCAAIETCRSVTCTGEVTCAGAEATCSPNPTCAYYPSCAGTVTCEGETCIGWMTCPGSSTCYGAPTCDEAQTYEGLDCGYATWSGYPSCHGSSTCDGFYTCMHATCAAIETCRSVTCTAGATCWGASSTCSPNLTCPTYPSCAGTETCGGLETCIGSETCQGSVTCDGAPTCQLPTMAGTSCEPTVCLTCVPVCPELPTSQGRVTCPGGPCPTSQGAPSCPQGPLCPTSQAQLSCPNSQTCPGGPCPTQQGWTCPVPQCPNPGPRPTAPGGPSCFPFANCPTLLGAPTCPPACWVTILGAPSCGVVATCAVIPCPVTVPGAPSCAGGVTCPGTPTCRPGASCPGVPTCAPAASCGGASCPAAVSCPGTTTCPGTNTCAGGHTCGGNPTCAATATCTAALATCTGAPTCDLTDTCGGWPTCTGAATCNNVATCNSAATCNGVATCPGAATCAGVATCEGSPTCRFTMTCDGWPTCQGPSHDVPDMLKLILDSLRYGWVEMVFPDDTAQAFHWDNWHLGPLSPLVIWDELDTVRAGEFVVDEWIAPPSEAGRVDTEYVRSTYNVGIDDHRDSNRDGVITVSDYLLLHFRTPAAIDSQSAWFHVEAIGTSQPGDLNYIIRLVHEIPPEMPVGCYCPCHADPSCDTLTNVFDVVFVVGCAFRNEPRIYDPACPYAQTDVNCDGVVDVFDAVRIVNVAFRNELPQDNFCDPCP